MAIPHPVARAPHWAPQFQPATYLLAWYGRQTADAFLAAVRRGDPGTLGVVLSYLKTAAMVEGISLAGLGSNWVEKARTAAADAKNEGARDRRETDEAGAAAVWLVLVLVLVLVVLVVVQLRRRVRRGGGGRKGFFSCFCKHRPPPLLLFAAPCRAGQPPA